MIRSYLTDVYTQEIHLLELGLTRIGRGPRVEIEIQGMGVSRSHCALVADEEGRLLVNDLGSKNGTKLDDHHLRDTQNVFPGQVLQVGARRFVVGQVDLSHSAAEQRALIMSTPVFQALAEERRQSA